MNKTKTFLAALGTSFCVAAMPSYARDLPRGAVERPALPGQPAMLADVAVEYVAVPSIYQIPGTPRELNQVLFVRLRHKKLDPRQVDGIVISQSGLGVGAGSPQTLAEIVEAGYARGKNIEVWAIDRRENLLEDAAGLRAAKNARDPHVAIEYYYGDDALDANGRFRMDAQPGGPGARFKLLAQEDVPFMAGWGLTAIIRDTETLLNLVPEPLRKTQVFLEGHSQGGIFVQRFASARLTNGKRGTEQLAGLMFFDGGPAPMPRPGDRSIFEQGPPATRGERPSEKDIRQFLDGAREFYEGKRNRYGMLVSYGYANPDARLRRAIAGMFADYMPDEESIMPYLFTPAGPAGGEKAREFRDRLRVTNLAFIGMSYDDDPIPGALLQSPGVQVVATRAGRLDFKPLPGTEDRCAESGPYGMVPPCVPVLEQIDPNKVYGWREGGPNTDLAHPLSGWSKDEKGNFTDRWVIFGDEVSTARAAAENDSRSTQWTNVKPYTLETKTHGQVRIDPSDQNLGLWYLNMRYSYDLGFTGRFKHIQVQVPELDVDLDLDMTAVTAPILAYSMPYTGAVPPVMENPYSGVDDFTHVGILGVKQTPRAAELSLFDPKMNVRLYHHYDITRADNSAAAKATPGQAGASVVPNTIVDWMLPRMGEGKIRVPDFKVGFVQ